MDTQEIKKEAIFFKKEPLSTYHILKSMKHHKQFACANRVCYRGEESCLYKRNKVSTILVMFTEKENPGQNHMGVPLTMQPDPNVSIRVETNVSAI